MHDFDEDASIDLTPVIDVIFMLLIFFIMTTTFSKPVLDIVLPASETAELQQGFPLSLPNICLEHCL